MVQKETNISTRMSLEASECGTVLFRNSVGSGLIISGKGSNGFIKKIITMATSAGCFAYRFTFGFGKGSSDKIGYTRVKITGDMVGKEIAVFTAIEVKTKTGITSPEQKDFLRTINHDGGIAILYRDGDNIKNMLQHYRF